MGSFGGPDVACRLPVDDYWFTVMKRSKIGTLQKLEPEIVCFIITLND